MFMLGSPNYMPILTFAIGMQVRAGAGQRHAKSNRGKYRTRVAGMSQARERGAMSNDAHRESRLGGRVASPASRMKAQFKRASVNFGKSTLAMALVITLGPATALATPAASTQGIAPSVASASNAGGTYDLSTIQDGTYTGTATVSPDEDEDFDAYVLTATVTVANHQITAVDYSGGGDENATYVDWTRNGRSRHHTTYASIPSQIVATNSTSGIDAVSGATCTSTAILEAVDNALASAPAQAPDPGSTGGETAASISVDDYLLVNIPFDKFYAAETGSNATPVDVLTSATKQKTTGELAGATYHNADGSEITGVTYAVRVGDEAAAKALAAGTQVAAAADLASAASYAYAPLDGQPASFKTVTAGTDGTLSFSAASDAGSPKQVDGTGVTMSLNTTWGDYEVDFGNAVYDAIVGAEGEQARNIAAAVIETSDGAGYGLLPVGNTWKASRGRLLEFAWSTQRDEVHEVQTNASYYQSLMGKTITGITIYTDQGTYRIVTDPLYVPKMSADQYVTADDAALASDGPTAVKVATSLSDFQNPSYTLDGQPISVTGGTILAPAGTQPGTHTFAASDAAGAWADVSDSFVLSTDRTVATYDAAGVRLVAANGASESDLANYIANISSVTVNGASYATGRRGTTIVKADGTIDLDVTSGRGATAKKVFDGTGPFQITIQSTGYTTPLSFEITTGEPQPAQATIERVGGTDVSGTSTAISKQAFPEGAGAVVIARNDHYADALSASALAGTVDAPILLTDSGALSASVQEEIGRLGARKAYIVGGPKAIDESIKGQLESLGLDVERIAGDDVVGTSLACAQQVAALGGSADRAFVSTQNGFWDALSVSGYAYANKVPVVLTTPDKTLTADERGLLGGRAITVLGGTNAVPDASVAGLNVTARIGGSNAFDTSNQIATTLYPDATSAVVARGDETGAGLDALAGSALAAAKGAPVLLEDSSLDEYLVTISGTDSEGADAWLAAHKDAVTQTYVLGGTVAVTPATFQAIAAVTGAKDVTPEA